MKIHEIQIFALQIYAREIGAGQIRAGASFIAAHETPVRLKNFRDSASIVFDVLGRSHHRSN
jgi:hypothetical protein